MIAGLENRQQDSRGLHIAIDARTINSSTGSVIQHLLYHLQQIDATNRYTIVLDKADREYWSPTVSNFRTVLADAPQYSFAEQLKFRRQLKALKPDLIHFCMPQQPLGFYRKRKITSFHDLTTLRIRNPHLSPVAFHIKNAIGRAAFMIAARESARIISCSKWTQNDVIQTLGVSPNCVRMIHDAGDVHTDALDTYNNPYGAYLLYVGSQFGYKNLQRLCDAHQELVKSRPSLGLIFVGRPDRESGFTQAYCAERGYTNITFAGYLPDAQRDWLYVNAAAYVFPSLSEGFGLPGLEAMGYGTPVVSSDRTCLPEIYGDAAQYFDPEDVSSMVRAIGEVIDNPALRQSLIERGHEQFKRYSWRRMAEQVLALYEEVGAEVKCRR